VGCSLQPSTALDLLRCKYLNNFIEQEQRQVKKLFWATLGVKNGECLKEFIFIKLLGALASPEESQNVGPMLSPALTDK
jgi:hypothetical protein